MKNVLIIFGGLLLVFGGGAALVQQITPSIGFLAIAAVAIVGLLFGNATIKNVIFGSNNTISTTKVVNVYMKQPDEGIQEIIE